jgi:hypothetical protein
MLATALTASLATSGCMAKEPQEFTIMVRHDLNNNVAAMAYEVAGFAIERDPAPDQVAGRWVVRAEAIDSKDKNAVLVAQAWIPIHENPGRPNDPPIATEAQEVQLFHEIVEKDDEGKPRIGADKMLRLVSPASPLGGDEPCWIAVYRRSRNGGIMNNANTTAWGSTGRNDEDNARYGNGPIPPMTPDEIRNYTTAAMLEGRTTLQNMRWTPDGAE